MMTSQLALLDAAISAFVTWLQSYGELSYDFQTFYAGPLGRRAKAIYYRHGVLGAVAVAPIIFCEAFVPSARRYFWIPQRFPIADAHYAMGFVRCHQASGDESDYRTAVHFLEALLESRCPGYAGHGWGYPFDWEGIGGTIRQGTPLITTLPYVYEAFAAVYEVDGDERWRHVMRSIAQHALLDYRDIETSVNAASCAYTPTQDDPGMVVNASAYRAFLLTKAATDFGDEAYRRVAFRNLRFVVDSQNADGSWYYAVDGKRLFIDHFHTCFVLKALAKIERLYPEADCGDAIERGVGYYVSHLFDDDGLPRPFSKAPRLIVYRRELYDYAECLNLSALLHGRFPDLDRVAAATVNDLFTRWQKPDGSFRSRQLFLGWDGVPMHRWAQAQTFRSLCELRALTTAPSMPGQASSTDLLPT
jgi:hypothetical protein